MSIVKFNSSGVKQWSRRIVGNCGAFTSSIVVGADDHLYLTATTFTGTENTVEDIHLVLAKYSFDGLVEWQRLLDYTAGYSFGSSFFGSDIGGSNLAVKQDYVAVGLGFGSEESFGPDFGSINAAIAQIPASGNVFTVGSWDFKSASFSGTVNSTASDILVTDADKTDYDNIANISTATVTLTEDSSDFLIGTLYTAPGGDNSLVNGAYSVILGNTGTVTLPAGGTITEGYVTSNPTIQLTPASPDVASQKLVIKGGGSYDYTDNGININYYTNTAIVGDTLTFYINSPTYAGQTLYWWIYPEGANISDPGSGTVVLDGSSGTISFELDSDDNEFTLRVSPEANNYDPSSLGVESGLINPDAPTFDFEHHLHLTTGDLTETSIILGTDNHNVRTTTDGGIEINTFLYPSGGGNGKWTFDSNGFLNAPNQRVIRFYDEYGAFNGAIGGDNLDHVVFAAGENKGIKVFTDDGTKLWTFGTDGSLTLPAGGDILDSNGASVLGGGGGDATGVSRSDDNLIIRLTDLDDLGLELRSIVVDDNDADVASTVLSANGFIIRTNSNVSQQQWQFGNDGSTTLPGAVVNSTVAKTGIAYNTGTATALSDSGYIGAIVDGNYGPFTRGLVTFTVVVTGGAAAYTVTNTTGNTAVNDVIGTLDTGDLGGTSGSTANISVADVIQAVTALDLTKSVNKLTDGMYSLADGVEGQIMYLARQNTSTYNAITVNVANARVDGTLYTTLDYYPFDSGTFSALNMSTLIFTDGAWQADNGSWD